MTVGSQPALLGGLRYEGSMALGYAPATLTYEPQF